MSLKTLSLAFALSAPLQLFTQAANAEWANVRGWTIDSHEGGCLLRSEFVGDTIFSIRLDGYKKSDMDMDIILSNPKWSSLVEGATYNVQVEFNRGTNWDVTFYGGEYNSGLKYLINYEDAYSEDSGTFAQDFMNSESVYIGFEGRRVENLKLEGSRAAFEEMVRCHRSFMNSENNGDPFQSTDPFR